MQWCSGVVVWAGLCGARRSESYGVEFVLHSGDGTSSDVSE